MFAIIVIILQATAVLFISIFARTDSTANLATTYLTLCSEAASLLLAFVLMSIPQRGLTIFGFVILLAVLAITVQTSILFITLWDSCFRGFGTFFSFDTTLAIRCIFASLSVLLTMIDFIGLFAHWQVYLIAVPILAIGHTFCSSLIVYGLKVFDGGGGMTVFLYSGVCSLMIWVICLRNRQFERKNKHSYYNLIMGFIGIIVAFISWPRFNVAGAVVSFINVNTSSVLSASYLQNSALANTFLGLVVAALMSLLFAAKDEPIDKLNHKLYMESFINGGIIISSYSDVALNPVACILPAAIASLMTLLIGKFYLSDVAEDESLVKTIMRKHPRIFARLIYPLIGIIVCSIVVAARNEVSPSLLNNNYSTIAGLEIAAFIIVLIISLIFGAITAVVINAYLGSKAKEEEGKVEIGEWDDYQYFGDLRYNMHPLHRDIFEKKGASQKEMANYTTNAIKESLAGSKDSPLRIISANHKVEEQPDPKQARLIIQKDYSKSNLKREDVSKLKTKLQKDSQESHREEQAVIVPSKQLKIQKSHLKITEKEQIPKALFQKRRLDFDQMGSEIKEEEIEARGVHM